VESNHACMVPMPINLRNCFVQTVIASVG
jgi:hypothetical protein